MIDPGKIFENIFDDITITDRRLVNFATDCLNRLIEQNTGGTNDALIAELIPLVHAAHAGENPASGFFSRLNAAPALDSFIERFAQTMKDKESQIAERLGGRHTTAYYQLYPDGKSTFARVTKNNISALVSIAAAATIRHADVFGGALCSLLKEYKREWDAQFAKLQHQHYNIENTQEGLRKSLELALLGIVHQIANQHRGNIQRCMSYFKWELLYPYGLNIQKDREYEEMISV